MKWPSIRTSAVVSAGVFLVLCLVIPGGLARGGHYGDVPFYAIDAHRVAGGSLPYRDFFFEYPPGALVVILLPQLATSAHYVFAFNFLMTLCGVSLVLVCGAVLARMGVSRERAALSLGAIALAPLALGPLVLDEYDLWPALVVAFALLAFTVKRDLVAAGLLGFGVATKIFPIAILPVALVMMYARGGTRPARRALIAAATVAFATYLPFLATGPGGVRYSIVVQARRGLQKESLGSAILFVFDKLGLYHARIIEGNPHWTELTGRAGDTFALLGTIGQALVAVAVAFVVYHKGRRDTKTLLIAAAAVVAGFVAFGKVFSPQYLIWLVPLVPLAAGLVEIALLGAALVLTQLWFLQILTPFDLDWQIWLVVLRDLLIMMLFGVLLRRLASQPASQEESAGRDFGRAAPT